MKKSIILWLMLFTVSLVFGQQNVLQIAPVNPDLVTYLKNRQQPALKQITAEEHRLGYIPHSIKYDVKAPTVLEKNGVTLPAVFDLREENTLTPVKDQSTCGACWTFATYGSIESRWLALGAGAFDLSEQNLKNGNGFEIDHCGGGNASIATAYLIRGDGPIAEADDPYNVSSGDYISGLTPQAYIPDARRLPRDETVIKQALYDYGALYTTMRWESAYYNASDNTYYYNVSADSSSNHAVVLVGWNDTLNTAGGTGAWIIRNSWGPSWGEQGYFYISYNDLKINSEVAYWPNRMEYDKKAIINQYDLLGSIGSIGYNAPSGYGLVKFVMDEKQEISMVGTAVNYSNATVSITIYDHFNGSSLSGLLATINAQSCTYPGYYSFPLSSPIELNEGDDIYIKVKYSYPSGVNYAIPVEMAYEGYANPDFVSGKCWVSYSGSSWQEIGGATENKMDLCVKTYGVSKVTAIDESGKVNTPKTFMLQNYPNPFNPTTVISYQLPVTGFVNLTVYNALGQNVRTLVNDKQQAGRHSVTFDASGLTSGVYVYRLSTSAGVTIAKKMIVLK